MSEAYTLPPWIPAEVSEAMREWFEGRYHGTLSLNYKAGQIPNISEGRTRLVLNKPPQAVLCPEPACRKVMEPQDYGNLFVCACGRKVTKNQLARIARAG